MGRPHTPLLDRDRIADAALRLTDRRGDFTILDLARALKVTPAAIYHHVDGRAGIVTLLRQKMAGTVDASAFGQQPWDEALRRWATSYRETFAAHPGAIQMLAAEPVADIGETVLMQCPGQGRAGAERKRCSGRDRNQTSRRGREEAPGPWTHVEDERRPNHCGGHAH